VFFPDENHWILKPQNSRLWYREFFAWLERSWPGGTEALERVGEPRITHTDAVTAVRMSTNHAGRALAREPEVAPTRATKSASAAPIWYCGEGSHSTPQRRATGRSRRRARSRARLACRLVAQRQPASMPPR
jgi:hypothetical protein